MNVHYEIQQGTIGVSRPKGKLLGIHFLTLVAPIPRQIILTHKQANRLHNLESTYLRLELFRSSLSYCQYQPLIGSLHPQVVLFLRLPLGLSLSQH